MAPQKFFNQFYEEVKPMYSGNPITSAKLNKALPDLSPATKITAQVSGNAVLPYTDDQINMTPLRSDAGSPTGKGYCAVVIDSGVNDHNYFNKGTLLKQLSTNGDAADVTDNYGHGTHMAGIIASNVHAYPGMAIPGMGLAPDSNIISIKVTRKDSGTATWSSIYRALIHTLKMVEQPDKFSYTKSTTIGVVNLSFNGLDNLLSADGFTKHKITEVLEELAGHQVPVVVSAGNAFTEFRYTGTGYPANLLPIIRVGALMNFDFDGGSADRLCDFSQRMPTVSTPNVSDLVVKKNQKRFVYASGACSVSLDKENDPTNPFSQVSGTSISAALVSGAILLYQEKHGGKEKNRSPLDVLYHRLIHCSDVFRNGHVRIPIIRIKPELSKWAIGNRIYDGLKYCKLDVQKFIECKTKLPSGKPATSKKSKK